MNKFVPISDKASTIQVLGGLMHKPALILNPDYKLNIDDFPERFHGIVFAAIENLAKNGAEEITPADVEQYLSSPNYQVQYKFFIDNNGPIYLKTLAEVIKSEKNFAYYYNVLKKYSLLNSLAKKGFDITPFYDNTITDPAKAQHLQEQFEALTLNDIVQQYEKKLVDIKGDFCSTEGIEENRAGDGLIERLAEYERVPEMGVPLISPKLTTIFRGRRLKKFYIESAPQGEGKSRRAAGEACHIAVPWYFNTFTNSWEYTGFCQPTLLISTELELEEVQTLFAAYVSGVDEKKILDGKYSGDERERVYRAAEYIKQAPLYVVLMTNFDIDDIENVIRKYHLSHQVDYVFFDYLSSSMKIMAEGSKKTRISNLREDQILLMFSQRLKDLCNNLGIHLQSATQLNRDWKNAKEADQYLLRAATSIADKVDCATILLPTRDSDKAVIEAAQGRGFETEPNKVLHIYKVRRGHYNKVKLYVHFDYATCRMEDCFVTDNDGKLLNIEDTNVEIILDETKANKEEVTADFENTPARVSGTTPKNKWLLDF